MSMYDCFIFLSILAICIILNIAIYYFLANILNYLLKPAHKRFPKFFYIISKIMPKPAESAEERANELVLTIFYLIIIVIYILSRNSYR